MEKTCFSTDVFRFFVIALLFFEARYFSLNYNTLKLSYINVHSKSTKVLYVLYVILKQQKFYTFFDIFYFNFWKIRLFLVNLLFLDVKCKIRLQIIFKILFIFTFIFAIFYLFLILNTFFYFNLVFFLTFTFFFKLRKK